MRPLIRGPIARRLFIFNILIVFMPVAGFFSLSLYEERLLADLENSMVQQGRLIAAWLQEGEITATRSQGLLAALKQKHTARIRIVDGEGNLLADSSDPKDMTVTAEAPPQGPASRADYSDAKLRPLKKKAETTLLYRVLSLPVRFVRTYLRSPLPPLESADFYSGKVTLSGSEIEKALSGSYGAIARISSGGQTSVTLYSAIPVMRERQAIGAVLVSQSTYRILASLYDFRLATGKIFILSLLVAALISLLLGTTISRPLSRLRHEAETVIAAHGCQPHTFHLTGRDDEVDRLSAALSGLVADLHRQIGMSEHFASDAAHEMRNRISGIRNAAELIAGGSADEIRASVDLILENSAQMETVIASLRDLSRIEACPFESRSEDAASVIEGVILGMKLRYPRVLFSLSVDYYGEPTVVPITLPIPAEFLEIIVTNLLDNAASFSPDDASVSVSLDQSENEIRLTVRDQGAGIPSEHLKKVFERFFSWRAEGNETGHAGIGLSLVEAIMRTCGGTVTCANRSDGGAEFALTFPVPDHLPR